MIKLPLHYSDTNSVIPAIKAWLLTMKDEFSIDITFGKHRNDLSALILGYQSQSDIFYQGTASSFRIESMSADDAHEKVLSNMNKSGKFPEAVIKAFPKILLADLFSVKYGIDSVKSKLRSNRDISTFDHLVIEAFYREGRESLPSVIPVKTKEAMNFKRHDFKQIELTLKRFGLTSRQPDIRDPNHKIHIKALESNEQTFKMTEFTSLDVTYYLIPCFDFTMTTARLFPNDGQQVNPPGTLIIATQQDKLLLALHIDYIALESSHDTYTPQSYPSTLYVPAIQENLESYLVQAFNELSHLTDFKMRANTGTGRLEVKRTHPLPEEIWIKKSYRLFCEMQYDWLKLSLPLNLGFLNQIASMHNTHDREGIYTAYSIEQETMTSFAPPLNIIDRLYAGNAAPQQRNNEN
ncbi:hypothetical protein [Vibrio breoganii]|uniref:hypothetical protein n=1 Tax=Vibrio breoganii TaxID=553239 RepID=UPI000C82C6F4|nr:hypothetical protein [Vibrio breoganii]PML15851.1 hypothetical protein BCT84_07560 [Vibrio breoganii]